MNIIHLNDVEIKYSLTNEEWSEYRRGLGIVQGDRVLTIVIPSNCKDSRGFVTRKIAHALGVGDNTQVICLEETRWIQ